MTLYPYWQDDKDAPYAKLLSMIETYCHPEASEDSYQMLCDLVRTVPTDADVVVFRQELAEVIAKPSVLPDDALFSAAEYDDGSDEEFLSRLWRDLYPDEPYPGASPA